MNVARLELCKELYERSWWAETYFSYAQEPHDTEPKLVSLGYGVYDKHKICPAYDLGYLLRKLPPVVTLKSRAGRRWSAQCYRGRMTEDGNGLEKVDINLTADTPEDAACKLAIELIKQGLLQ